MLLLSAGTEVLGQESHFYRRRIRHGPGARASSQAFRPEKRKVGEVCVCGGGGGGARGGENLFRILRISLDSRRSAARSTSSPQALVNFGGKYVKAVPRHSTLK